MIAPAQPAIGCQKPVLQGTERSTWEDFVEHNNPVPSEAEGNELVATHSLRSLHAWGNLANARGYTGWLSFAYKRFDGVVPEPGPLDDEDQALLEKVEAGFETVGELYNACKFRAALNQALALAREANGYLDRKAPWFQIKEDRAAAATSVYVILRVVDNLKTILAPILPHTPVLRTGHSSCMSTWGTRGSCSGRSMWSSIRKRPATAGCAPIKR